MAGLGKTRSGASYGPKKKAKRAPSHQSGGTSGDLTVPGYKPKTPTRKYKPSEPSHIPGVGGKKTRHRKAPKKGLLSVPRTLTPDFPAVSKPSAHTSDLPSVSAALHYLEGSAALKQAQGDNPARDYLKETAKTAKKAIEQRLNAENQLTGPTREQIETAATLAALAPAGGGAAAERGIAKAANVASDAKVGEKVVKAARAAKGGVKARGGAKVESVRSAPTRYARRIKEAPSKIKGAPKRVKTAAVTKEGRRAAAKGAGRTARRHPVRSGYGAAAVSPVPLPGELDKRARAFLKGTAAAAINHPGKVAETTLHGVLGALTAPLAVGGSVIKSAEQGSTKPFRHEIRDLVYTPASADKVNHLKGGLLGMGENLASGDPKLVEKSTLQQTGLTPFIPVPHVLRRLKGTKAYEESRAGLRGKVETKRSATRTKRIAAEKAAVEGGQFVSGKKARKIRQSVADTRRPGEHYALRRTGKLIEKQRSRHYIAREVSRMEREGEIAGKTAAESVSKKLRKSPGTPGATHPKKTMDLSKQNDADALAVILKHGLPLDHRTLALAERLKKGYDNPVYGEVPAGLHLDRHSVQWIIDHPQMFEGKRGKAVTEAVEAFDKANAPHGTSLRHQYLAQVDNLTNPILKEQGRNLILKPEEMITPEAVKLLPKRDKPWNRSETLDYIKELKQVKGTDRAKALKQSEALAQSIDGLMKPPEHGGAEGGVSTTRAVAWTPEMEKAFVKAARRENARNGLRDPSAYVANKVPSGLKGSETASALAPGLPLRKVWPSRGIAAKSGNAASDYESLIYHSLEAPHSRKATVEGLNRVFDKASRKLGGKRYLTGRQVETAINTHKVPDGTIFVRTQFLKSVLEGEHHLSPEEFTRRIEGEIEHGQKLAESTSVDQIRNEMLQAKAAGTKGEKYSPMDAVAIHELMGHIEGPGKTPIAVGKVTNKATSFILNSPAFEISQFFQEGIPGAAALGRNVVHLPTALKRIKEINKLPADQQGMIRAVVGSGAGTHGAPSLKALRSSGYMDPIRAAGGKQAWRHALEILNGAKLNRFDRARGGYFREVAASARIQGDFRRASKGFNKWRSSTNNLFKGMDQAVKEMKGLNRSERELYVASHPKLADRLTEAMNGQMGNWNSFTVFEKQIAPFAIFYNFQRYAVMWTLYHFPLDHPIVATALASLGEVNAQQLQQLAAKTGSVPGPLDYTKPVINGETVLPAGQRFFSGLSSPAQAAVEGKPEAAIGGLSPAISIPLEAIGGKNTYTGQELGENGWMFALRQTGNLSPFLRFIGAPDIGKSPSPGSQVYGELDPLRDQRSFVNPLIGQSAKDYGEEKRLSRKFSEKYGEGKIPYYGDSKLFQHIRYGFNGGPNPNPRARKKEIAKAVETIHAQESAKGFIKRKEQKYYGPEVKIPKRIDEEIRKAFEDAWMTGPNAKPKKAYRVPTGTGLGGKPIGGSIGGESIGGSIGGESIGGRPIGGGP